MSVAVVGAGLTAFGARRHPAHHRGTSAQVTVITGTTGDGAGLDYHSLAATRGTLVIFMGLVRLAKIADKLILHGRALDEPAAVVSNVSLPDQRVAVGTLSTIAAQAESLPSPAVVYIGDVAAFVRGAADSEQHLARAPNLSPRLHSA